MLRKQRKDVGQSCCETEDHGKNAEPIGVDILLERSPLSVHSKKKGLQLCINIAHRTARLVRTPVSLAIIACEEPRAKSGRRIRGLPLSVDTCRDVVSINAIQLSAIRKGHVLKFRVWNSSLSVILAVFG